MGHGLSEWGYTPNVPPELVHKQANGQPGREVQSPKNQKTARQEKEVAKNGNGHNIHLVNWHK